LVSKLSDCAEIRTGLILSRKLSREKSKNRYPLLNLKSFNDDATLNLQLLDVFDSTEALNYDYLTHIGDVIVRTSSPYTAILIDEKTSEMVVSSNFVIIRCDKKQLLPDYLYWYLNTSEIKKDIFVNSAGNMLAAIKPQYFCDMNLMLPDLKEQRKIARINLIAKRELELLSQLKEEKEKYYQACLEKLYKKQIETVNQKEHENDNQK
jgi:restriction endonuclease S subunit